MKLTPNLRYNRTYKLLTTYNAGATLTPGQRHARHPTQTPLRRHYTAPGRVCAATLGDLSTAEIARLLKDQHALRAGRPVPIQEAIPGALDIVSEEWGVEL